MFKEMYNSLAGAETPLHFIMTLGTIILIIVGVIQFIQLFYNLTNQKDPYSQSPHWLGNIFRLLVKILMIVVKLVSYVMMAVVWLYYKTRIVLYIIWAKITGKKPDATTPPPYNASKN